MGITSHPERRIWEHKHTVHDGFTRGYTIVLLVCVERYEHPQDAIAREKDLKDRRRERKVALMEVENALWLDLSAGW